MNIFYIDYLYSYSKICMLIMSVHLRIIAKWNNPKELMFAWILYLISGSNTDYAELSLRSSEDTRAYYAQ